MAPSDQPQRPALSGVVEGSVVFGLLLLGLRIGGVAPLAAYAVALACGTVVAVLLCRHRGGADPAVGMAIVLTVAYSMLVSVLAVFLLAVLGVE